MNTIYDVQQFLKRFGIFVYLGDRLADLEMMENEIKELYKSNLIEKEDFQMALLLLRRDIALEKEKRL
ncbi:YqgQ family protein [Bacillus sp. AGMB 02131]|uniref:YqgQ family protein n=1 Tax=Peribacillus faecalis TaxID=2772559 RepID=A0A927CVA1_9BACI|nr:YqgQ family protein [Peribacillus faecalis]MBD3108136.1 YqgQ family protein [Peribacillus faecalis]